MNLVYTFHFYTPYAPTSMPDMILTTAETPIIYVGFYTDNTSTALSIIFLIIRNVYLGLLAENICQAKIINRISTKKLKIEAIRSILESNWKLSEEIWEIENKLNGR